MACTSVGLGLIRSCFIFCPYGEPQLFALSVCAIDQVPLDLGIRVDNEDLPALALASHPPGVAPRTATLPGESCFAQHRPNRAATHLQAAFAQRALQQRERPRGRAVLLNRRLSASLAQDACPLLRTNRDGGSSAVTQPYGGQPLLVESSHQVAHRVTATAPDGSSRLRIALARSDLQQQPRPLYMCHWRHARLAQLHQPLRFLIRQ